ncbi:vacuolar fusion protein MON1 homolog A isoform X1 [Electrophorus electricus]|uniref:Vacuolar fusion protein MON1 homolog n=1 Tax=Electrophorus electricus TaxID=8005 RepID=A0A4W4EL10_ELEEL|nr:vacuolar fusion protein MON1 homolog A isoform X1 [Electrophorus electricus]XP_026880741.2 vacuolar fusion protein MON1 homolog A isoform X1 [Electrophorus electricus]XP_035376166.1 vacuolar fusion protein MON1 homolog A isoform X1 [Electrophorus electricus]
MAADVHNKGGATWDTAKGGLAAVERMRSDRSDSPTPGLVEGTEPGAGQEHTMFVHAQSFEDLTADSESNPDAELTGNRRSAVGDSEEVQEGQGVELQGGSTGNEAGEQKQWAGQQRGLRPAREEDVTGEAWRAHRKHVFVLSEAGKPIYTRYGTEEALSTIMGVMMALVSFVEAEKNIIRSIHADGYRVVFLHKSPLVLVGVSRSSQSERELSRELQYVYYQIVSLLTLTQLDHVFRHKQNYDLRRLLAGSEHLTDNLLRMLEYDPGLLLNAVTSLPLASVARDALSAGLQVARAKSLVFSILLAGSRLVTLVRKKDQYLHHMDLHLLFNLVGSSSSFREGEGWTPICLPKFNTAGFFHAHISYLEPASNLCLILVSTDREDFFNLSDCRRRFLERLRRRSAYKALQEALHSPTYPVSQVGIPELWHFVYKSKSSGLYTSPELPVPYQGEEEHERLIRLYRYLHSCLHHPTRPLRSMYRSGNTENLFAWATSGFELYLCFSPLGTKALAMSAVTKLLKWIRKEEDRLFILNPLTY